MTYTEQQITKFCELAQEIGIGRSIKELGYPKSWNTGHYWTEQRGVKVATDDLRAKAAATREWYKEEEIKTVAQAGMEEIHAHLMTRTDLTADDMKKLSEALYKFYNTWASVQGKAANISENRHNDITLDPAITAMFDELERENTLIEREDKPKNLV